ncbi:hypothetical protein CRUP_018403 [Coryphaenoides rupestris]|nr:hypothetical protein CRUP_018403 [Coryphaenoides rupestris]
MGVLRHFGGAALLCSLICSVANCTTARYSTDEEDAPGTEIGNLSRDLKIDPADDPHTSFRFMQESNATAVIHMREIDGLLSVAETIDREHLCPGSPRCLVTFDIVAFSRERFHLIHVEVEVRDVNDHAPAFHRAETHLQISENAQLHSRFPLDAAIDLDVGRNYIQSYNISSPAGGSRHFVVDNRLRDDGFRYAELVLVQELDREVEDHYVIEVTATDGGVPPRSGSVTVHIRVLDFNDNSPTFERSSIRVELLEDAPVGHRVLKVRASDPDQGANGEVTYAFADGPLSDAMRVFRLDPHTGDVALSAPVDFEKRRSYEMTIRASDSGVNSVPSTCKVLVDVVTERTNAPEMSVKAHDLHQRRRGPYNHRWPPPTESFVASESNHPGQRLGSTATAVVYDYLGPWRNNVPGSYVTTVVARDADAGEERQGLLQVLDSEVPGWRAHIHVRLHRSALGGSLYTLTSLDYETLQQIELAVQAEDGGSPPRVQHCPTVRIRVVDQNGQHPVLHLPRAPVLHNDTDEDNDIPLPVNAPAGYLALRAEARDEDEGVNGEADLPAAPRRPHALRRAPGTPARLVVSDDVEPSEDRLVVSAVAAVMRPGGEEEEDGEGRPGLDGSLIVIIMLSGGCALLLIAIVIVIITCKLNGGDRAPPSRGFQGGWAVRQPAPRPPAAPVQLGGAKHRRVLLPGQGDDVVSGGIVSVDQSSVKDSGKGDSDFNDSDSDISGDAGKRTLSTFQPVQPKSGGWRLAWRIVLRSVVAVAPGQSRSGGGGGASEADIASYTVGFSSATVYNSPHAFAHAWKHTASSYGTATRYPTGKTGSTATQSFTAAGDDETLRYVFIWPDGSTRYVHTRFVALINTLDRDSGSNGDVRTSLHGHDHFKLQQAYGDAFMIVTTTTLDREKIPEYNLTLVAEDLGSPPFRTTRQYTIRVTDENDNAPFFSRRVYDISVLENNVPGSYVTTVVARDADAGKNAKVSYKLLDSEVPGGGHISTYVSIDPLSGSLYTLTSLDYETLQQIELAVQAEDGGSPPRSSTSTVRIRVVDQNDNTPYFTFPAQPVLHNDTDEDNDIPLPVNAPAGYLALRAEARDEDEGVNGELTYRLLRGDPTLFAVHRDTGEVVLRRWLPANVGDVLELAIAVSDKGRSPRTATAVLRLVVSDDVEPSEDRLVVSAVAAVMRPGGEEEEDGEGRPGLDGSLIVIIMLSGGCALLLIAIVIVIITCKLNGGDRAPPSRGSKEDGLFDSRHRGPPPPLFSSEEPNTGGFFFQDRETTSSLGDDSGLYEERSRDSETKQATVTPHKKESGIVSVDQSSVKDSGKGDSDFNDSDSDISGDAGKRTLSTFQPVQPKSSAANVATDTQAVAGDWRGASCGSVVAAVAPGQSRSGGGGGASEADIASYTVGFSSATVYNSPHAFAHAWKHTASSYGTATRYPTGKTGSTATQSFTAAGGTLPSYFTHQRQHHLYHHQQQRDGPPSPLFVTEVATVF